MTSEKRKRRKRNPNIGAHPIKPNHYKLPMCEICRERKKEGKMKRGYKAKIKHENRELCIHHFALLTGRKVIIPPHLRKKKRLIKSSELSGTKKKKREDGDEFYRDVEIKPVEKGPLGRMLSELLGNT